MKTFQLQSDSQIWILFLIWFISLLTHHCLDQANCTTFHAGKIFRLNIILEALLATINEDYSVKLQLFFPQNMPAMWLIITTPRQLYINTIGLLPIHSTLIFSLASPLKFQQYSCPSMVLHGGPGNMVQPRMTCRFFGRSNQSCSSNGIIEMRKSASCLWLHVVSCYSCKAFDDHIIMHSLGFFR